MNLQDDGSADPPPLTRSLVRPPGSRARPGTPGRPPHVRRPRTTFSRRRTAHDDVTSYLWQGCGRQADLVLPDEFENALRIVGVDGEDVGCPPSGPLWQRRGLTELWPGVLVQRRRVHKKHIDPASPQLEAHSVPVLDQERHTEQWQWIARASRRGNRIERSKPKHARDALLAVPLEVAQPAQVRFRWVDRCGIR